MAVSKINRGAFYDFDTNERWDFQFNPTTITTSKEAVYADVVVPGRSDPIQQYSHGSAKPYTVPMMIDCLDEGDDARTRVLWLEAYCYTEFVNRDERFEPPPLLLVMGNWAPLVRLRRVNAVYTLWRHDGTAARANLSIRLQEMPPQSTTKGRLSTSRSLVKFQSRKRATQFGRN